MREQSQVQRTLGSSEAVNRTAAIPGARQFPSRTALGRRICEGFGHRDPQGRWQVAGCLKALNCSGSLSQHPTHPSCQAAFTGVPTGASVIARIRPHGRPGLATTAQASPRTEASSTPS